MIKEYFEWRNDVHSKIEGFSHLDMGRALLYLMFFTIVLFFGIIDYIIMLKYVNFVGSMFIMILQLGCLLFLDWVFTSMLKEMNEKYLSHNNENTKENGGVTYGRK